MPPTKNKVPSNLRPYIFHGVELQWELDEEEAVGDCPWCGKENKFSVNLETGMWQCFVCREGSDEGGGNVYTFLKQLWKQSRDEDKSLVVLSKDRNLSVESLDSWGIVRSSITGEILVPAYNTEHSLCQLYKYISNGKGKACIPTPTLGHYLFRPLVPNSINYEEEVVCLYVCEGPWDGIALDAALLHQQCQSEEMDNTWDVISIPGLGAVGKLLKSWASLFHGKIVNLMFDNDYPRTHPKTGKYIEPAGYSACKKAAKILSESGTPPKQINYLNWGEKGYDPTLPKGTDVRDIISV